MTIAKWVAARLIYLACVGGARRRGSSSHRYWWEQPMELDEAEVEAGDDQSLTAEE